MFARRRSTSDVSCLAAEERRRAAAEVDEAERPAAHHRQLADQLDLARQGRDVALDVVRVLVGVDAEVAELAALAAERNVQIQAQRHARAGGAAAQRPLRPRGSCSAVHCENGG